MFTYLTCIRSHRNLDVVERKKYLGKVHCTIAKICTGEFVISPKFKCDLCALWCLLAAQKGVLSGGVDGPGDLHGEADPVVRQ